MIENDIQHIINTTDKICFWNYRLNFDTFLKMVQEIEDKTEFKDIENLYSLFFHRSDFADKFANWCRIITDSMPCVAKNKQTFLSIEKFANYFHNGFFVFFQQGDNGKTYLRNCEDSFINYVFETLKNESCDNIRKSLKTPVIHIDFICNFIEIFIMTNETVENLFNLRNELMRKFNEQENETNENQKMPSEDEINDALSENTTNETNEEYSGYDDTNLFYFDMGANLANLYCGMLSATDDKTAKEILEIYIKTKEF